MNVGEIKKRLRPVSFGEFTLDRQDGFPAIHCGDKVWVHHVCHASDYRTPEEYAEFIVHAPTDIADLLKAYEKSQAQLDRADLALRAISQCPNGDDTNVAIAIHALRDIQKLSEGGGEK